MGASKKKEGDNKLNFDLLRKMKDKRIISLFIVLLVLLIILFFLISKIPLEKDIESHLTCGDGTFYGTCSLNKPYYCGNGVLIERSSICGCPDFLEKRGDSCISNYATNSDLRNLNYVLNSEKNNITLTVYEGIFEYVLSLSREITYRGEETPFRTDFKLKKINNEKQRFFLMPLVKEIQNIAPDDKIDQARIAISLVQNIPWGASDRVVDFRGMETPHSRFPYEVIYDEEGICGEKSELLSFLLRELGYGTVIFYFQEENHEAVGIKCPVENSFSGTGYCFIETNGPSIISDDSIIYSGGITLDSSPKILRISEGISLPKGIQEYSDAKKMQNLRNRWWPNFLRNFMIRRLDKKYGLEDVYEIG